MSVDFIKYEALLPGRWVTIVDQSKKPIVLSEIRVYGSNIILIQFEQHRKNYKKIPQFFYLFQFIDIFQVREDLLQSLRSCLSVCPVRNNFPSPPPPYTFFSSSSFYIFSSFCPVNPGHPCNPGAPPRHPGCCCCCCSCGCLLFIFSKFLIFLQKTSSSLFKIFLLLQILGSRFNLADLSRTMCSCFFFLSFPLMRSQLILAHTDPVSFFFLLSFPSMR